MTYTYPAAAPAQAKPAPAIPVTIAAETLLHVLVYALDAAQQTRGHYLRLTKSVDKPTFATAQLERLTAPDAEPVAKSGGYQTKMPAGAKSHQVSLNDAARIARNLGLVRMKTVEDWQPIAAGRSHEFFGWRKNNVGRIAGAFVS
ncbi:MAG: hypothetical protein AB7G06_00195 [Bdellovibrionales bacterium]